MKLPAQAGVTGSGPPALGEAASCGPAPSPSPSVATGVSSAGGTWSRRRRSVTAHRPRGPRDWPAIWVGDTSVPGSLTACPAATATGPTPSPRCGSGGRSVGVGTPHAERRAHAREQGRRRARVAGRRGVEPVLAEHLVRRPRELRPEQVAERHGASARLDDRHGLRGREVARPTLHQGAQRLADRLDGAQVGTGADDDLRAERPDPPHGLLELAHRRRALDPVRHVVGADHDEHDIGAHDLLERVGQLSLEVAGLGPDDGPVGQAHPPTGQGGDAAGDDRADRLVCGIRPQSGRGAVTEHDDVEGLATAGAVDTVVVGRVVERCTDDPSRERRLDLDDAPAGRPHGSTDRGQPTAAVGRGGRDLAGPACASHQLGPLDRSSTVTRPAPCPFRIGVDPAYRGCRAGRRGCPGRARRRRDR